MKILGVTGGMGMGKSTVCSIFRKDRFPVFDADQVVHQLQSPQGKAMPYLKEQFPSAIVNGCLDRKRLRDIVIRDPAGFQKIESIVLPLVAHEMSRFLRQARRRKSVWCILDIPLLFEKKINRICTKTLVVDAPYTIQKWRITNQRNISWDQAKRLISKQIPNTMKCRWADIVIHTGLSRAHTFFQVKRLIHLMKRDQL